MTKRRGDQRAIEANIRRLMAELEEEWQAIAELEAEEEYSDEDDWPVDTPLPTNPPEEALDLCYRPGPDLLMSQVVDTLSESAHLTVMRRGRHWLLGVVDEDGLTIGWPPDSSDLEVLRRFIEEWQGFWLLLPSLYLSVHWEMSVYPPNSWLVQPGIPHLFAINRRFLPEGIIRELHDLLLDELDISPELLPDMSVVEQFQRLEDESGAG